MYDKSDFIFRYSVNVIRQRATSNYYTTLLVLLVLEYISYNTLTCLIDLSTCNFLMANYVFDVYFYYLTFP